MSIGHRIPWRSLDRPCDMRAESSTGTTLLAQLRRACNSGIGRNAASRARPDNSHTQTALTSNPQQLRAAPRLAADGSHRLSTAAPLAIPNCLPLVVRSAIRRFRPLRLVCSGQSGSNRPVLPLPDESPMASRARGLGGRVRAGASCSRVGSARLSGFPDNQNSARTGHGAKTIFRDGPVRARRMAGVSSGVASSSSNHNHRDASRRAPIRPGCRSVSRTPPPTVRGNCR